MALGIVGPAPGILQMRPPCIRSLMPEVLLLSIPGHSIVTHLFVSSVAMLHLLGSLWDLSSPAPALSVCTGGSYCESSVHIYVIFLAPIMYFTVCTFCISIKVEMELPVWLLRK